MNRLSPKDNFCGLSKQISKTEKSHFLILPIPYEATTSYGHGTKLGPEAIINASLYLELYDEELFCETYRAGIETLPFTKIANHSPESMYKELSKNIYAEIISKNYENKFLICLGGEHSISPAIVKAFKKKYNNLSVLHLDAHADLRDSYHKTNYSHACANRRIAELCPSISCGIRSLSREEAKFIDKTGQKIYFGKTALNKIKEIVSSLSENVFITFDVDVLDPSIMPSTGTPEPEGWTWSELRAFLKEIIINKNVVGMDVVELAPLQNIIAPDFSIAKLIYRIMGYIALSKGWMPKPIFKNI